MINYLTLGVMSMTRDFVNEHELACLMTKLYCNSRWYPVSLCWPSAGNSHKDVMLPEPSIGMRVFQRAGCEDAVVSCLCFKHAVSEENLLPVRVDKAELHVS